MAMKTNEEIKRLEILKKNSSTFYYAGLLLPKKTLAKAATLYSFCRWIDDIADEANDSYRATYHLGKINSALNSHTHVDNLVSDVQDLLKDNFGGVIPASQLIDAVSSDLGSVRIDTTGTLLRYCYGVAGTVGIMMCAILKPRKMPLAWRHAVDLGIAMQLTNICRDVYEDAKMGRRYLPAELVGDITPTNIVNLAPENDSNLRVSVRRLINLAEQYYSSGLAGIRYLPLGCQIAIYSAAVIYRDIGRSIKNKDCLLWRDRCYVSNKRKLFLILFAAINVLIKNLTKAPLHRKELHSSIREECKTLDLH